MTGKWRADRGQVAGRPDAGKWQAGGRQMRVSGGQANNAVDWQVAGRVVFGVAGMPATPIGVWGGIWGGAVQSAALKRQRRHVFIVRLVLQ